MLSEVVDSYILRCQIKTCCNSLALIKYFASSLRTGSDNSKCHNFLYNAESTAISRKLNLLTFSRVFSLYLSSPTFCSKPCNFFIWLVVNYIAFVLVALNTTLFFEHQVSMFESSLVRASAQYFICFALQCWYIVEFSVQWRQVQLGTQFFISVTDKLNNSGPKSYPCGTPNFEYKRLE